MMRALVIFWAAPLGFFWSWYFLSLNDLSFGTLFFSRRLHDLVFAVYGEMLGVSPAELPGMTARACVLDSVIVLALVAFRRRRQLAEALEPVRRAIMLRLAGSAGDQAPPAE